MLLIKNFTRSKVNERFLRRIAQNATKNISALEKTAGLEIDLAIVGEKRMKTLNRVWRGKDKITDVLSFESGRFGKAGKDFIFAPDAIFHLGQIFICYSVAARQARKDGHFLDKEMAVLLIHGILHLAGYDHEKSVQEARKMFRLQEKIMNKI